MFTASRQELYLAKFILAALWLCLACFSVSPRGRQRLNLSESRRVYSRRHSRFTQAYRHQAIVRALRFIYNNSRDPKHFAQYGSDFLWCFYSISASVDAPDIRQLAPEMGIERATIWRQEHNQSPASLGVDDFLDLIYGADGATSLGLPNEALKSEIQRAALRFTPTDFFHFDPRSEPPPTDVPEECRFDQTMSPRGSLICRHCGRRLKMRSRYDVWCEALVTAYTAEHYGVTLGAGYDDVVRWLPRMKPYQRLGGRKREDFIQSVYAVTHIVYTLNDYDQSRLPAELLPDEFQFLKRTVPVAIAMRDGDMLGELIDALKSLGLSDADPHIRLGVEYLLAHQNADGSWGNQKTQDDYDRYHPTWNGIVALSNYTWRGPGPSLKRRELLHQLLSKS